ncbi:MAG: hypothetical protein M3Y60_06245, partial [Bacteroidota bacterium]|nr:hypothetical protein [Bacteroidota bacterium]
MRQSFAFVLLILLNAHVHAQEIIEVDDSIDEFNFMPYQLTYLIDSTNSLSLADVSSQAYADGFRQHSSYQNKDFRINTSYWIRLPVRHTTKTAKTWLFEFYDQTIDHLDAYLPQVDGTYKQVSLGDKHAFRERMLLHKNFEILLDMKSDTLMVYYFRVQSHGFAD